MSEIIAQGYKKAIEVLKKNSTKFGFVSSSSFRHYFSIWARDSCITILGTLLTGDKDLLKISKKNLANLKNLQSELGQIIGVYWPEKKYWDWCEIGCIDGSAWYIIACFYYFKITQNKKFLKEFWPSIKKALLWLQYQDQSNFGLIDSQEAADWMDSSFNRGGKVFYNNCLFYKAALSANKLAGIMKEPALIDTQNLKLKINALFWPEKNIDYSVFLNQIKYPKGAKIKFKHEATIKAYKTASKKREYYLSHINCRRFVDVCDVLANCLAIIWDIADKKRINKILKYFFRKKVTSPYPAKTLPEPILKENDKWGMLKFETEKFISKRWRNPPFCYHNAGIWSYVGGFYVLMLVKCGRIKKAKEELEKLAQVNKIGKKYNWEFNEWLHGQTGKPMGAAFQSWSAAGYIMAYKAVMEKKLIF